MKFNPTNVQRRIAMAAAVAVAILLYLHARSSGPDEGTWPIGILVIAALLVAAFAPAQTMPAGPAPIASNGIVPFVAFRAALAAIEPTFVALAENTNEAFRPDVITSAFVDHARMQAVKLAWIAGALAIAGRDHDFLKTDRMAEYSLVGGGAVLNLLKGLPRISEDGGRAVVAAAAKEMAACRVAFDLAAQCVATERVHPINPVFAMIERDFPFAKVSRSDIDDSAERLDAAYGPLFRAAVAAAVV
jgi:hypothetical protein